MLNALDPNAVDSPEKLYGMAKHWRGKIKAADHNGTAGEQQQQKKGSLKQSISCKTPGKGEPLEGICVKHPDLGTYVVAPVLDGRITCVNCS